MENEKKKTFEECIFDLKRFYDLCHSGYYSIPMKVKNEMSKKTLKTQIGGSHYKHFSPEPMEWFWNLNVPFTYGNMLKYVLRYPFKNGLEDLKKAKHCLEYALERECENTENNKNHMNYSLSCALCFSAAYGYVENNKLILNEFQRKFILTVSQFFDYGKINHLQEAKYIIDKEIYLQESLPPLDKNFK